MFQDLRRMRFGMIGIALIALAGAAAAVAADTRLSADDAYLDALQGKWIMSGTLGGKPARYVADGRRVLLGGFLKLHMLDTGASPQYEATTGAYFSLRRRRVPRHLRLEAGIADLVAADRVASGERVVVHVRQLHLAPRCAPLSAA